MKTSTKIWLIAAAVAVFAGICICTSVLLTSLKSDKTDIEGYYAYNTYELENNFQDIDIETLSSDVCIVPSEDGKCKVISCETKQEQYKVKSENGVLKICPTESLEWYENLNSFMNNSTVMLYLPNTTYGNITVKSDTGAIEIQSGFRFNNLNLESSTGKIDCASSVSGNLTAKITTGEIKLGNLTAGSIETDATTGKTQLEDVSCESLVSRSTTGRISLTRVLAEGPMNLSSTTGEINLKECDASNMEIETSTGNVEGVFLSEKVFRVETKTGSVDVPKTTEGGICSVKTVTGNVHIETAD